MIEEYSKQVVHSAIAHYLLTSPQPVLEHQANIPWPTPPGFIVQHNDIEYGIFLGSVRASCPSCVPFQLLVHTQLPHQWGGVGRGAEMSLT